jgi:pilus assembly protein FimV
MDLDLDLGNPEVGTPSSRMPLDNTVAMPTASHRTLDRMAELDEDDDPMSLDFTVPESAEPQTRPAHRATEPAAFDLSDISLDLDLPATAPAAPAKPVAAAPSVDPRSGFGDMDLPALDEEDSDDDPLSRKLELAEEFRQIGDNDGARDLLQEVVAKSSGAVKSRAQSMLADLG